MEVYCQNSITITETNSIPNSNLNPNLNPTNSNPTDPVQWFTDDSNNYCQ